MLFLFRNKVCCFQSSTRPSITIPFSNLLKILKTNYFKGRIFYNYFWQVLTDVWRKLLLLLKYKSPCHISLWNRLWPIIRGSRKLPVLCKGWSTYYELRNAESNVRTIRVIILHGCSFFSAFFMKIPLDSGNVLIN